MRLGISLFLIAGICLAKVPSISQIKVQLAKEYKHTPEKARIAPMPVRDILSKARSDALKLTDKIFTVKEFRKRYKDVPSGKIMIGKQVSITIGNRRVTGIVRSISRYQVRIGDIDLYRKDFPASMFETPRQQINRKKLFMKRFYAAKKERYKKVVHSLFCRKMRENGFYLYKKQWHHHNNFHEHVKLMAKDRRGLLYDRGLIERAVKKTKSMKHEDALKYLKVIATMVQYDKKGIAKAIRHRQRVYDRQFREYVNSGKFKKSLEKALQAIEAKGTL